MGRKCCVPGCKSNYDNTTAYTSVFKFPSDKDRKALWLRSINRLNFQPSPTAVVCVEHFEDRFVIREDTAVRDDGSLLVVPRKKLGLKDDAYPTRFSNLPSYLTKVLPPERKSPAERQKQIIDRDEQRFVQWCSTDMVTSFEQFSSECSAKLGDSWILFQHQDFVLIYKLDTECPKVTVSFKVKSDLTVNIWHGDVAINIKSYEWLLGSQLKCDRWSKFENILGLLSSYKSKNDLSFELKLKIIIELLNSCSQDKSENEDIYLKLKFLKQQIILLTLNRLRYTPDIILWCSKLYFTYPSAYNLIRDSNVMTIPHPCTLKKLSLLGSTSYTDCRYSAYLKKKASLLEEHEKLVNVLLDEIYVIPSVTYKSGHLFGISENSTCEATTIQAFMISSLLSKNKDVVALFPVRNLNADLLLSYTHQVLKELNNCGFTVLCLISDNNRINRNMFTSICGGQMKPFINNPYCEERKLFFLFDSVHLIKAIRNNWLNQTNTNQVFYFPSPVDSKISCANLVNLKKIYESEKQCIAKLAPKLCHKVLDPTSLEKQNVKYALNLFHETNSAALEMSKDKLNEDAGTTKLFIDFIWKWWKIMNVKHPLKGLLKGDQVSKPIESMQDESVLFLQNFSHWVNEWNKISLLKMDEKKNIGVPGRGGMLSKETFFALKFSTDSVLEIIKHLLELGHSYVLLGKFQTDSLEARFGQYRQMSGGNYSVSCTQIFESENKLRILSMLTLCSESKGKFQIKDLDFSEYVESSEYYDIPEFFYETFNSSDDFIISDGTMHVLIFIAGYVAYKVCAKLSCDECIQLLTRDKNLDFECPQEEDFMYIKLIDRGGLKWPQEIVIKIVVNTFQIFQKLVSRKFEQEFFKYRKQKNLLVQLAAEKLELLSITVNEECTCGNKLIKQCLSCISNILLNNYSKVRNDNRNTRNYKRKLATLTK